MVLVDQRAGDMCHSLGGDARPEPGASASPVQRGKSASRSRRAASAIRW